MKWTCPVLAGILPVLAGCSMFITSQRDVREGNETAITTRTVSWTLFTSKSDLANFKVTQTEKTQSANVGTLSQTSSEPDVSKVAPLIK